VLALVAADWVASESYEAAGGQRASRQWHELEAELVDGSRTFLDALTDALVAAGARLAASPSKLAQALGDLYPAATGSPARDGDSGSPARDGESTNNDSRHDEHNGPPTSSSGRAVVAYLREQRDELIRNDALVRTGDADGVHDMRVAIRRLRATLRTFRAMLDLDRTESLRAELKWLGGLLGAVRDGDVLRRRFDKAIAAEPADIIIGPVAARVRERFGTSAGDARAALAAGMTSSRYVQLLDELDAAVDDQTGEQRGENELGRTTGKRLRRAARKAVRRADVRLDAARPLPARPPGVAFPSSAPENRDVALHEARKAYKRARYAAEALAPAAGKPARRLAKRLRILQDILGEHQDSVVGAQLLRDYGMRAHLDGDNAFSYGVLYAQQTAAGHAELAHLDRARRRAGRPAVRDWLR
jgi:CHAD domain-containing protein